MAIKFTELGQADTPLDLTEIVALVQGGVSKQTPVSALVPVMDAGTIKGNPIGGVDDTYMQNLTGVQVGDIVWNDFTNVTASRRADNNVGRLNVPVSALTTRALAASDAGDGLLYSGASTVTLTIPLEATEDLGDGFVATIACSNAGGTINVEGETGAITIVNFGEPSTGDQEMVGVGIATIWKIGTDTWGVHGTNIVAQ